MTGKAIGLFAAITVLSATAVAGPARAQVADDARIDSVIDALSAVKQFGEAAISPDGRRVAWSDAAGIRVAELSSAEARRVSADPSGGTHDEHGIAWSPDGSRFAFLSDTASAGQFELYVANTDGGEARKLTDLTGFLSTPRWSPDAGTIAFLFIENSPRAAGPLVASTPDAGVVESQIFEQRIATVDLESGRVRQISPADLYVYEYDWAPDGAHAVATAAHGSGDNSWWIAEVDSIDLRTGEATSLAKPTFQVCVPRWSPDGKTIALIGGLMSDAGLNGGDIYVLPATGGAPKNITSGMKASATWLAWQPSSDILFTEIVGGSYAVATVGATGGKVTTLWTGAETLSASDSPGLSVSKDGKVTAAIRVSYEHAPEVWAGPVGAWKQVTNANAGAQPAWSAAKSVAWKSDGYDVQGWLLYPHDFDPSRRYPMVVTVHGGPSAGVTPNWGSRIHFALPSAGYFVFLPNPRGSFGQGEAFTRANVKDFGYGDLRDILAGVDAVVKTAPVDPDRVGIYGWSYGGFMTMWAVTQTHRFRAAMAGAGICNWQSYYGENRIDQWMIPFFGASVYDDPAVYAKSSPITFIKETRTPTLVVVGDRDAECPAPQSYEFWHALKTLGVDTQFVVYPNEGHAFADPAHRRDVIKRGIAWFDRHLSKNSAP